MLTQECISGLGDYPELIGNNYKSLLDSMSFDK